MSHTEATKLTVKLFSEFLKEKGLIQFSDFKEFNYSLFSDFCQVLWGIKHLCTNQG